LEIFAGYAFASFHTRLWRRHACIRRSKVSRPFVAVKPFVVVAPARTFSHFDYSG
jgi:hypothetical protein